MSFPELALFFENHRRLRGSKENDFTMCRMTRTAFMREAPAFAVAIEQSLLRQTVDTAACNVLHNLEERLARWLLSDRSIGRRPRHHRDPGKTFAFARGTSCFAQQGHAAMLRNGALVDTGRGRIAIRDRSISQEALAAVFCRRRKVLVLAFSRIVCRNSSGCF